MTDQEAKFKELEVRIKKLEDKVFDAWLSQYDACNNPPSYFVSSYNYDYAPIGPFHGCSQEEILRNNLKWEEFQDTARNLIISK